MYMYGHNETDWCVVLLLSVCMCCVAVCVCVHAITAFVIE